MDGQCFITLLNKKRNERIREKTRVQDIVVRIIRQKWSWTGHVTPICEERSKNLLTRNPGNRKWYRERSNQRWTDYTTKVAGSR